MTLSCRFAPCPDPRSPQRAAVCAGASWAPDGSPTSSSPPCKKHSSQRIAAVGSRSIDSATGFARRFGIERAHGSYEELVSDPDVDVVYIATPHNAHLPSRVVGAAGGQAHLVEKPLALNADQGAADRRRCPQPRPVLHGGVLDRVPAEVRRPASASRGRRYRRRHRGGRRLRRMVPPRPPHSSAGAGGWTNA